MAGPQQQPPYLHLAELTASQFLEIWKHFDADGNGYIEGKELENFFQELEKARKGSGMMSKSDNFGEKMKEFMQKYDKNSDGKIEMAELAQILPTEENFLLCFRQHVGSSAEFMEAWRKYDTDRSGYIEANELKGFLSDLLKKANRPYDEPKLQEYTQTILRMFDLNGDGKLGLSEMSRLLPVQENFLLKFQGMKLTSEEFNAIFTFYDKDGSGYIDEHELDALLKDLYEKNKKTHWLFVSEAMIVKHGFNIRYIRCWYLIWVSIYMRQWAYVHGSPVSLATEHHKKPVNKKEASKLYCWRSWDLEFVA
ncbi:PREDICTED: calretinin isoform X1 [Cercocebus atys]|uniref:calretinin isoform X1 n=1 Tax=Cercocebus atys TaxID=9531 RepID=UPI0005F40EEF|nr:PREDICTED: calretinin isoform X1 [Cercocebus atys]